MLGIHFPSCDSTNAVAKRLAALNRQRPMLISAAMQTAGRGRRGRVWQSPGGGAWFTLAYPSTDDLIVTQAAPLAVAAAVVDELKASIRSDADHAITIKWPNDVLLNNRKVCGILCERTIVPPMQDAPLQPRDSESVLILGVGLNVNIDPLELAAGEMRYPPTSLLTETEQRHEVRPLIRAIGERMRRNMDELCENGLRCGIIKTVKCHLAWRGATVTLQRGDELLSGVIMGIDGLGRLMLATSDAVEVINSGEVTTVREMEPALPLNTP